MDEIEKLANIFKALSEPTRLRLVNLLSKNDGALCVNAMSHMLGVTQSAVSLHLRILRQTGLVRASAGATLSITLLINRCWNSIKRRC